MLEVEPVEKNTSTNHNFFHPCVPETLTQTREMLGNSRGENIHTYVRGANHHNDCPCPELRVYLSRPIAHHQDLQGLGALQLLLEGRVLTARIATVYLSLGCCMACSSPHSLSLWVPLLLP